MKGVDWFGENKDSEPHHAANERFTDGKTFIKARIPARVLAVYQPPSSSLCCRWEAPAVGLLFSVTCAAILSYHLLHEVKSRN
jgi:hypothetical protein